MPFGGVTRDYESDDSATSDGNIVLCYAGAGAAGAGAAGSSSSLSDAILRASYCSIPLFITMFSASWGYGVVDMSFSGHKCMLIADEKTLPWGIRSTF